MVFYSVFSRFLFCIFVLENVNFVVDIMGSRNRLLHEI